MIPSIARTPKCAVKSAHADFKFFRTPESFTKNPKKEKYHRALNIERGKSIKINLLEVLRVCVKVFVEMVKARKRHGTRMIRPRQEHPITRAENFLTADNVS